MVKLALAWTSRRGIAVAVTCAFVLVLMLTSLDSEPKLLIAPFLCSVAAGLAVLWPQFAALLLAAIQLVLTVTYTNPYLGAAVFAFPLVLALCAAGGHRLTAAFFAIIYVALFLVAASRINDPGSGPDVTAFWIATMFAPILIGEGIWQLHLRSDRQQQEQQEAAEHERQAIARDLHDHLAYATTTMVMKADQARLRGGQDEQTLADLEYIAATGRSATADLRTMLALLREARESESGSPVDQGPGLLPPTRLQEVLEAQRSKLAAFDFDVNLDLNGDLASVPDRPAAVLSRVVTEVASNITKHGRPHSEVSVMIDLGPHEVETVIVNQRRDKPGDTGHRGLGLLGLQEIVTAAGGELTSSPVGDRWINHLTLPLGGGDGA